MAAVTDIYRDEVLTGFATFELDPPSADEMTARFASMTGAGCPVLVARRDGVVAGYAYAAAYRSRAAFRWTLEDSVYVSAAARRQGVGRMLISRLLDESAARGFRQMVAIIGGGDNVASVRVHSAAGFATVGVQAAVGWKGGRWVDTIVMQRAIGEGSGTPPT